MNICVLDLKFFKKDATLTDRTNFEQSSFLLHGRFLNGMPITCSEQDLSIMCVKWFPLSLLLCTLVYS